MAQRDNQRDTDGNTYQAVGVQLGTTGLDLRQPSQPGALSKLLNARFEDDRVVRQRDGHSGVLLQDRYPFPALGGNFVTDGWVYGHGQRFAANPLALESDHHPIAGRAEGGFFYDGNNVVWTGDRLLVVKGDEPALGGDAFWEQPTPVDDADQKGIAAYLPMQVDSNPPTALIGNYIATALTRDVRAVAHTSDGELLSAEIIDRVTGTLLHSGSVTDDTHVVDARLFVSGPTIMAFWRDTLNVLLRCANWSGFEWEDVRTVAEDCTAYDVAVVPGGLHVVALCAGTLLATRFSGKRIQDTPYESGTALSITGIVPSETVALGVSPDGYLCVVTVSANLKARIFNAQGVATSNWTIVALGTGWDSGVAVTSRGLRRTGGSRRWVVHASRGSSAGAVIIPLNDTGSALTAPSTADVAQYTRFNSVLASRSFRVGDEVFCWLRTVNSSTHYLVGGFDQPQVCGIADREEATERFLSGGTYALQDVLPDPLDEEGFTFTWARPFNTGQTYNHGGNVRIGDIDFVPALSAVRFGKSVYLSGSSVRCWDGVSLGDAGFSDYPVIEDDPVETTGPVLLGQLTFGGVYYYRAYAVRYNARGERFQSAAISSGPHTIETGDVFNLVISTIPTTNHDDVVFEVYRTEAGGSTFYLEGAVENELNVASVSFVSAMPDETLISRAGDSHAAGNNALSEVEEWQPVGCSLLAVSGDRLWAAGGQVPPGLVHFSKLKEEGEGAGFDTLAGFQTVDTEGRPVTSITALNDVTVVFQLERLNVLAGTGPDNYGRGNFSIPQIMLADGALNHLGTVVTQQGALYWGLDGPRLLTSALKVLNISAPVRSLTEQLVPSGVKADLTRQEVVWYTRDGRAVLWNYLGQPRWAEWGGLRVAASTETALVTTDGWLLTESPDAVGDAGAGFPFVWASGNLRADDLMAGSTFLRSVGLTGAYRGPHRLRVRVYYNGSPLWTDQWVWEPETDTWLIAGDELGDLTPAEIDALGTTDRSGAYLFHKRVSRPTCSFFRVEISNIEAHRPTYIPFELSLELGTRGGVGRTPVATVATKIGR